MIWLVIGVALLLLGAYVWTTLPRARKARRFKQRKRELASRPSMRAWATRHGLTEVLRAEQAPHERARGILDDAFAAHLSDITCVIWAPTGEPALVLVESHDPAGQCPLTVTAQLQVAAQAGPLRVNAEGPPPGVESPHLAAAQAAVAGLPADSWVQVTRRLDEPLADDVRARLERLAAALP
jgi:hypothetical protein